jgi:malonate-semialdehyde dehydrogenase (acetylating)/methylmalonate-semialdehyde dehydrogenase
MTTTIDERRPAEAPETAPLLRNFVGGKWVAARAGGGNGATPGTLPVPNPATEELLAHVPLSGADDVDAAVTAARDAFPEWAETPVPERVRYLHLLRSALLDQRDALIRQITIENGKVYSDAAGEFRRALEVVDFAIGMPTLIAGYNVPQVSRGIDTMMERYPVGVAAAITPFNFPFMVPFWTLPIAIAAGNTYILKPSERTPLSAIRVMEILDEIGLPPGVANLVLGAQDAVQGLLNHPGVDAISFVGSAKVARIVYETAARNGKRVQALGGAKNHLIVMPDAVVAPTVESIAESAFGNAGQRCLAGSVMTLVGKADDAILPPMIDRADSLKLGFGLDEGVEVGPVIRQDSRQRILGLVDEELSHGGRLLRDGRASIPDKGFFVGPTLMELAPDSPTANVELFGPVLSVTHATDVDDAIRLANETNEYGNAASIYTSSGYAARQFRRYMPAGMLGVNIGVPAPVAFFPFSGQRGSFFGDLHVTGHDGVEFFTRKKTTTTRWFQEPD